MQKDTIKIILVYALACLIWGSTWMAIRVGLDSLTPFISVGLRFSFAALFILIFMKIKGMKIQMDKLSIKLYLQMAFFSFVIPYGLVYWGEQYIPSGLASVLFAINPFFVTIFSFYMLSQEKITSYKIIGMIVGFIGIVVIFSEDITNTAGFFIWGMVAVVLSALIQGWIQVVVKKYGQHLHSFTMNYYPMLIAGISMLIIGLFTENLDYIKFDSKAILSVLYLAFFGSMIVFTCWYWLLKRVNVIVLSLITFITPVIALILGIILLKEVFTVTDIFGSFLVLAGLIIATLGNVKSFKNIKFLKKQPV
jgi:drug/metabolite transporter (DMT)-like permease